MRKRATDDPRIARLLKFANGGAAAAYERHRQAVERSREHPGFRSQYVLNEEEVEAIHGKVVGFLVALIVLGREQESPTPTVIFRPDEPPWNKLLQLERTGIQATKLILICRAIEEAHPLGNAVLVDDLSRVDLELDSAMVALLLKVSETPTRVLRCAHCWNFTIEDRQIRSPQAKRRRYCSPACRREADYKRRKKADYWRQRGTTAAAREQSRLNSLFNALEKAGIDRASEIARGYVEALNAGKLTLPKIYAKLRRVRKRPSREES